MRLRYHGQNGLDAVGQYKKHRSDLIIMEAEMSCLNGYSGVTGEGSAIAELP
jgi:CheY-like chemotaxis protein